MDSSTKSSMELTAREKLWRFKDQTDPESRQLTLRGAGAPVVELCLEGHARQGWAIVKESVLVPRMPVSADLLRISLPWPNLFGRRVDLDLARILAESGATSLGEMTERAPVTILLGDYCPWTGLPGAFRPELGLDRFPNLRARFCRRLEAPGKRERIEWRVSTVLTAYLRGGMSSFPGGGWFSETLLEWLLRRPAHLDSAAEALERRDSSIYNHYGGENFWKAFATWIRMQPGLLLGRGESAHGRALLTVLATPGLAWLNGSLDRLEDAPPDRKGLAEMIRALLESLGQPGSVRGARARLMAGRALEAVDEPGPEPVL